MDNFGHYGIMLLTKGVSGVVLFGGGVPPPGASAAPLAPVRVAHVPADPRARDSIPALDNA